MELFLKEKLFGTLNGEHYYLIVLSPFDIVSSDKVKGFGGDGFYKIKAVKFKISSNRAAPNCHSLNIKGVIEKIYVERSNYE